MIGVLSLQGDFAEHLRALFANEFEAIPVKTVSDLDTVSVLVIPGGESTVIGKLIDLNGLREKILLKFRDGNLKIWGTCAGAILLASSVNGKGEVLSLGLANIEIERNAYGNQLMSFETRLKFEDFEIDASFIRAPIIKKVGGDFKVLLSYDNNPVMVANERVLVTTFHMELAGNARFYTWLKNNFFTNE